VHPTLGILARFQTFFYASAFSQSDGVPPPAPARVTQTVRRLLGIKGIFMKHLENLSSITGQNIFLRPIVDSDYQTLFSWRNESMWLYLWSHPRRLVSFNEYANTLEKSLQKDVDIWLMIMSKENN
jgi:hypothetical protein